LASARGRGRSPLFQKVLLDKGPKGLTVIDTLERFW